MRPLTRNSVVALAALLVVAGQPALAKDAIKLRWGDLIPQTAAPNPIDEMKSRLGLSMEDRCLSPPVQGIVERGQPVDVVGGGAEVVTAYGGKTVELSGYVIPLDYTADGVTAFMLVPFVGACIHVPPPRPNQLVFVTTERPFMANGLFEPFTVTGTLSAASTQTQLAEVGYAMKADTVRPFE